MTGDTAIVRATLDANPGTHISQPDLAWLTGIGLRRVQEAVRQLVLEGVPVCSDDDGHWIASTPEEVEQDADRLEARLVTQTARIRAQRRNAEALRAPTTLWGAA